MSQMVCGVLLPVAPQVWGSVMPLSFFPAYCGIVLLSAAAVQKFFVVSVAAGVVLGVRRCAPHVIVQTTNPCLCCVQENKKVQEISGNITKSIAAAF